MRKRVAKMLIGFVAIAIFIGLAETSTDSAKKQEEVVITTEHNL
ncbi:hypothetical protein ACFSCX_19745 [Bacillus salitolerans]|uniref:Uncharacterized protein n=1 Tax=Bacillus salitolerans TaxID=1437434 RepID=A0ABW4LUB4_9BACI